MATAPLEKEIGHGNAGLVPWSALGDVEENVPDLIGLNAVRTYNKMRQDAHIASLNLAFTLPILRYRWVIEPNGARDQVVEWVAKNMSLPIAGQEDAPTGRRRDRFSHDRHLFHALLNLSYGHMYFEQVYRFDDETQLYRLRKLAPRMPGSISEINVARDGGLDSIRQFPSGWTDISRPSLILPSLTQKPIPVTQLVAYINEQEGGNWRGVSWLRALYRHWIRKDRLLRVDAINGERNGAGVPIAYAPPGASNEQIAELGALARSYGQVKRPATAFRTERISGSAESRARCPTSSPASGTTTSRWQVGSSPCSPNSAPRRRGRGPWGRPWSTSSP